VHGDVAFVHRGHAVRIVIAGGGVIALLTAVNCVSSGHEVTLVDQADIPFSGATSFDRHRVMRALHLDDPAATTAAVRAHHRWIGLQRLLSTTFYERIGALTVVAPEDLPRAKAMLDCAGSPAQVVNSGELATNYPHVGFPPGVGAVFESHAGVLLADRVLTACAGWLRWHSHTELHPHRKVVEVDVAEAAVRLADGEVMRADAVLLAIGPWSRALLAPELVGELLLHRQSMLYCEVPAPDAAAWSATPTIPSLGEGGGAWLVPPVAGTPLKLSAASARRVVTEVGDNTTPPYWRDHLVDTFAGLIPGFRADWLIDTRDCYYLARAATRGPMLAVLGDRVVSYAACGGSSFKFAPLIARCLAERLTGADPAPTGLDPLDVPIVCVSPDTAPGHRQGHSVMRGVS
jgi:glycine/D-amino acid oxidase-like deaminating enzyme